MTAPASRRREILLWSLETLVLVGLAIWTRLRTLASVVLGDVVLPLDTDCHFHLHRSLQTLARFPHVPARDPLAAWPGGAIPAWAPGFDQLCALPPWLLGLRGDPVAASRVIVLVPVALGVALVLLTRALAARLLAGTAHVRAIAWTAGLLAAVLPQAVVITEAGRTDHHGAEALVAASIALWTLYADDGLDDRRAAWRWELAGAVLFAASVHVYSGAVLFAGVAVGARTVIRIVHGASPSSRAWLAPGSGTVASTVAALALVAVDTPWILEHRQWFHPLLISYLQPALLAFAGAFALAASMAARHGSLRERLRAAGVTVAGALVALAIAAVALPGARAGFLAGLVGWLAHRDPWMDRIVEVRPLFDRGSIWRFSSWREARDLAGFAAFASPLLLALTWVRVARVNGRRAFSFAAHALAYLALTLVQWRFGRPLMAFVAVWIAAGLAEAGALLVNATAPSGDPGSTRLPLLITAAGVLAMATLDPDVKDTWVGDRGRKPLEPIHEIALYLRAQGIPAVPGRGAGVLAPWDRSNEILDVAGRPTVVTSFGRYTDAAQFDGTDRAWRGDDAMLDRWMAAHDARFLVTGLAHMNELASASTGMPTLVDASGVRRLQHGYYRALPNGVLWFGGSSLVRTSVRASEHFLPVFASSRAIGGLPFVIPWLWVYERVTGAHIVGDAPPGSRVVAEVQMWTRDAPRTWTAWVDTRDGHFDLVVPVPNDFDSGTVRGLPTSLRQDSG
ncbi:MAG: hypothetical protein WCJ30_13575, partial [Deltaproteobacteria bacterium]